LKRQRIFERWGWERTNDRNHFVVQRHYLRSLAFVLTSTGMGLTILSASKWLDPKFQNYDAKMVSDVLKFSPFSKSLSLRISGAYGLSAVSRMRRLEALYIDCNMAGPLDLSGQTKLTSLGASSSEINKISGLKHLPKLKYVHARGATKAWLNSLPESVEILFHTGKIMPGVNFSSLVNLRRLGIDHARVLDFELLPTSDSLSELDLTRIGEFKNSEQLLLRFPNLRTLNVSDIRRTDFDEIVPVLSGITINIWDGLREDT
jgi:hypothetical protein